MTPALRPSEVWKSIPWKKFQRNVFRLQKRIYRAKQRGDVRTVHRLTPIHYIGVYCFAPGRPGFWPCDGFLKITEANEPPE